MNSSIQTFQSGKFAASVLLDLGALALIYFTPALSHMLNLPLYLIEPMRLMLVLALVHTNKMNAYLLAFTLPLFSFLFSGHPVLPKMLLITGELVLNVFFFYLLASRLKNTLFIVFASIILSKIGYYLAKFVLLQWLLLEGTLFSTPVFIQLFSSLIFSLYAWMILKNQSHQKA